MNKLKMKAKAGVTLVELLVVILIVTVLAIGMLPLLQPYITESQYASEAIPVVGSMRTKTGLYVYEKAKLPFDQNLLPVNPQENVMTWTVKSSANSDDIYNPGYYDVTSVSGKRTAPVSVIEIDNVTEKGGHIQNMLDLDYQDLKGKRARPTHFQYLTLNTNTASYVVGCFGDGTGLKAGTGYAVCELNFPLVNRKLIGTWKRYKSYNDQGGAIAFTNDPTEDTDTGKVLDCYVPTYDELQNATDSDAVDMIVGAMTGAGWEF